MAITLSLHVSSRTEYLVRALFINVIPAHRLPGRLRSTMPQVGPAALVALVATDLGHAAGHPGALWPLLAAVLVGGVVSALTRNLALTIVGGFAAAFFISIL